MEDKAKGKHVRTQRDNTRYIVNRFGPAPHWLQIIINHRNEKADQELTSPVQREDLQDLRYVVD